MKPTLIHQVFEPATFSSLCSLAQRVDKARMRWEPDYNRWAYGDHEFFIGMHAQMLEQVQEVVGEKLQPSYCLLAKYGQGGVVQMHKDRDNCYVTLAVKLYGEPWPFYVAGKSFVANSNSGILFNGSEHYHYRDARIDSSEHCIVLFHYAKASYEGDLK